MQLHRAAVGELHRIADQVREYLLQTVWITKQEVMKFTNANTTEHDGLGAGVLRIQTQHLVDQVVGRELT